MSERLASALRLCLGRPALAFLHDVGIAAASFVLAVWAALELRFGQGLDSIPSASLGVALASYTAIAAAVFWLVGLYRGIWRYASLDDLLAILRAAAMVVGAFVPALFLLTRLDAVPRSALPLAFALLVSGLAGPRMLYRVWKDRGAYDPFERSRRDQLPVLLLGAGDEAEALIRQLSRERTAGYRVVGLIDEKDRRVGRRIRGVRILGSLDDLPQVVSMLARRNNAPQSLVLTKPMDPLRLRGLLRQVEDLGMSLRRVPRPTELRRAGSPGAGTLGLRGGAPVEPIAIEDLLGRPQAVLDRAGMAAAIAGRRILITGAGGSIGSELARQLAALGPAHLALVDLSEFALYGIDLEIGERHPELRRTARIADIRDAETLARVLAEARPDLVFHAAALKHVPIVELQPSEGALTNAIGTRIVADAAVAAGCRAVVMISTDKAINPTNVMGATKRLAECYCQALDRAQTDAARGGTRFVTVRFGNVLGSTGSVVPLFQRQLARGGPLTVTHPDMTRYFMTIREAVELVLQAYAVGAGTSGDALTLDRGSICVLDMGEPVRILDLARQMIRLQGLIPEVDIPITFTGLRPGEKLFEELFHPDEPLVPSTQPGILLARPRVASLDELRAGLDRLEAAARRGDHDATVAALRAMVPEYAPTATAAA